MRQYVKEAGEKEEFQLVDITTSVVTPQAAQEILQRNVYAGQRKLSKIHVARQVRKMQEQTWREVDIALAFMDGSETPVLVNGQHQLNAVVQSGIHQPMITRTYHCRSQKGLARLYAQFDNGDGDKARSMQDVARSVIEGHGLSDNDGERIPDNLFSMFASGLSIKGDTRWGAGGTKDEKYRRILDPETFPVFLDIFHTIFKGNVKSRMKHVTRTATIRAMFDTWRIDPDAAREFWIGVRDGVHLEIDDPRKKLERFLWDAKVVGPGSSGRKVRATSVRELYCVCIHAWNAYRHGLTDRKVKRFKFDDPDPVPI